MAAFTTTTMEPWAVPMHGKCRFVSPSRFSRIPHIRLLQSEPCSAQWYWRTGGGESQANRKRERKSEDAAQPKMTSPRNPVRRRRDHYWLVGRHFGETVQSQGSRKGGVAISETQTQPPTCKEESKVALPLVPPKEFVAILGIDQQKRDRCACGSWENCNLSIFQL